MLSVSQYYGIHVVDSSDGRGVPQVDMVMTDGTRFTTDSDGYIAFNRSGYMNTPDVFTPESYGYQLAGGSTVTLIPTLGSIGTVQLTRLNIAERLYRETGEDLYAATVALGFPSPITHATSDAAVYGQDTLLNVIYKNQEYWFWGDTDFDSNVDGVQDGANYRTTGAVTALPSQGGISPAMGLNFNYFVGSNGEPTAMFPQSQFPDNTGPYWMSTPLVVADPNGNEKMICIWSEHSGLGTIAQGFAVWDETNHYFDNLGAFSLNALIVPGSEATPAVFGGQNYFVFDTGMANERVKADYADVTNINSYQTYTPLKAGSTFTTTNPFGGTNITSGQLNRDSNNSPLWAWQSLTQPLNALEVNALLGSGLITKATDPYLFTDVNNPGTQVAFNSGNVEWNDYLKQWVQISQQLFGSSLGGEIWISESPNITGPWNYAEKVQTDTRTNNTYTFYNVEEHPNFAENDSPYLYYEGTYTNFLVNGGLTGDYFNNNGFTGYAFEQQDSAIDFNWGSALPDSRLTSSNFSINWSGQIAMPSDQSGGYVFKIATGGGVTLKVNGQTVINDLVGGSSSYTGTFTASAGATYNISLQYRNITGSAGIVLSYAEPATPTAFVTIPSSAFTHPPAEPLDNYNNVLYRMNLNDPRLASLSTGSSLTAQFFNGSSFNSYVSTSNASNISFNWGAAPPAAEVSAGNFSARFTGEFVPTYSQTYTLYLTSDGTARLWLNGQLLINDFSAHSSTADTTKISLNANQRYDIRIDYADNDSSASLKFEWQSSSQARQVVPASALYTSPNGLVGTYFNGTVLASQVLQTLNQDINYNWFSDSPDLATVTTNGLWSAEWDGQIQPDYTGVYTFSTTTDDGARLWVNGQLLIDDWHNQGATTYSGSITLVAGERYDIRMEYYNSLLTASAQLMWSNTSETGGAAQIIPTTNLYATTAPALPGWLSADSAPNVTWTPSTSTLSVFGPATVTGDPAAYGDGNASFAVFDAGPLTTSLAASSAIHTGSINLSGGSIFSLTGSTAPVLLTSSLSMDSTSTLDLGNGFMDIAGGDLASISGLIAHAYNGGAWNGTGIGSSAAAADTRHLTAVGAIVNAANGNPLHLTFDGAAVSLNDVLLRYTYVGDADLSGRVDGSDYSLIDSAFATFAPAQWINGDFNDDRLINGSDYTLIDNAFNSQGTAFTPSSQIAVHAVQLYLVQPAAIADAQIDELRKSKKQQFGGICTVFFPTPGSGSPVQ